MKTVSLVAIISSVFFFFIASKTIFCLNSLFFFFNSFLSIAMFLRVTEEHLDVEKGRLWDKLMFICTKREGTLVLRPLLPTSFLNSRRQGEFPPFWQVSKSWESWNVIVPISSLFSDSLCPFIPYLADSSESQKWHFPEDKARTSWWIFSRETKTWNKLWQHSEGGN